MVSKLAKVALIFTALAGTAYAITRPAHSASSNSSSNSGNTTSSLGGSGGGTGTTSTGQGSSGTPPVNISPSSLSMIVFTNGTTASYQNFTGFQRVIIYQGGAYTSGTQTDAYVQSAQIPLVTVTGTNQSAYTTANNLTLYQGGDQAAARLGI